MRLRINGEEAETSAQTVADLLSELKLASGRVAVEVNLALVRRADHATHPLNEGDVVEIVNFVGGGDRALSFDRDNETYPAA